LDEIQQTRQYSSFIGLLDKGQLDKVLITSSLFYVVFIIFLLIFVGIVVKNKLFLRNTIQNQINHEKIYTELYMLANANFINQIDIIMQKKKLTLHLVYHN
jgi:hypothetical protein